MKISERLAKLIDVKSIITFGIAGAFVFLSAKGKISPENFMTIASMIFAFYFGTQNIKQRGDKDG